MVHGEPHPMPGSSVRPGLWRALVRADEARSEAECSVSSGGIELGRASTDRPEDPDAGRVIDLAERSRAHLGYLERVGSFVENDVVAAPAGGGLGRASGSEAGALVIDLSARRGQRALSA